MSFFEVLSYNKRYFNVIAELFLSINASVLVCYDKTFVEFAIQFQ